MRNITNKVFLFKTTVIKIVQQYNDRNKSIKQNIDSTNTYIYITNFNKNAN